MWRRRFRVLMCAKALRQEKAWGRPVGREVEPMKRHAVGEQWWRGKSG